MKSVKGTVLQILITPPEEDVSMPIEPGQFDFEGLRGDKHYGLTLLTHGRQPEYPRGTAIRNTRQITILSREDLITTSAELEIEKIDIRWLAGNLLVTGIPYLSLLPVGSRFLFQNGVVLVCNGENDPCSKPARITQENYPEKTDVKSKFVKAAMHRRGVTAWVEHPGSMQSNEEFHIELPAPWDPYWKELIDK